MSKASLETELRERYYKLIFDFLESIGEQPMGTGTGQMDCPTVSSDGEESFVSIKISIPRGRRVDGTYSPYYGYDAHQEWEAELEARLDKQRASAEKKERAEAEKERKRQAKKTVKTMKKDVEEIFGGTE